MVVGYLQIFADHNSSLTSAAKESILWVCSRNFYLGQGTYVYKDNKTSTKIPIDLLITNKYTKTTIIGNKVYKKLFLVQIKYEMFPSFLLHECAYIQNDPISEALVSK